MDMTGSCIICIIHSLVTAVATVQYRLVTVQLTEYCQYQLHVVDIYGSSGASKRFDVGWPAWILRVATAASSC
jgi:hypothetical protein